MKITFDPDKASENVRKHGISFEEAASCLLDPLARVREDDDAVDEQRLVLLGMSVEARLIVVVYTLRDEDEIRLISARKATNREKKSYA